MSKQAPHENPLVPNQKLRQIYTTMVEMQILDWHVATLQRGLKNKRSFDSTKGQEACRASSAVGLVAGDLISDTQKSPTMNLLYGVGHGSLLNHIDVVLSGAKEDSKAPATGRQLPWVADANEQLTLALGASLAFKTLKQPQLVIAYLRRTDISKKQWREALVMAARLELPILIVVLPAAPDDEVDLCGLARRAGVPGIPVDANDVVALYRVAQESIGRARAGDGPVLMECFIGLPGNRRSAAIGDAIAHLREYMISRHISTRAWAEGTGKMLRKKIAGHKTSSR